MLHLLKCFLKFWVQEAADAEGRAQACRRPHVKPEICAILTLLRLSYHTEKKNQKHIHNSEAAAESFQTSVDEQEKLLL